MPAVAVFRNLNPAEVSAPKRALREIDRATQHLAATL
jgi:hypothetical protein